MWDTVTGSTQRLCQPGRTSKTNIARSSPRPRQPNLSFSPTISSFTSSAPALPGAPAGSTDGRLERPRNCLTTSYGCTPESFGPCSAPGTSPSPSCTSQTRAYAKVEESSPPINGCFPCCLFGCTPGKPQPTGALPPGDKDGRTRPVSVRSLKQPSVMSALPSPSALNMLGPSPFHLLALR